MSFERLSAQSLGVGAGLRPAHYPEILSGEVRHARWFEAVSENFMDSEGYPMRTLERVRRDFPVALHGVSLSIGSAEPLSTRYLDRLKTLITRIDPFIVSDHLCWTGAHSTNLHDLLPIPFTDDALDWVVAKVQRAQDFLGRAIALENVSSYLTYRDSVHEEWDFLREVATRSGCGILLDINNVYVSASNHGFDPLRYLDAIPSSLVAQIHLGGYTDMGDYLFDTHSRPVHEPVWKLYEQVIRRMPQVPVLIEWDDELPEFSRLEEEVQRAEQIRSRAANAARNSGANPARVSEPSLTP